MLRLSPYFEAIKRNPHFCPECGHPLELNPLERTWDGAMWRCPACKWFQVELAPEAARRGPREPARPQGRVIEVDFGRRSR